MLKSLPIILSVFILFSCGSSDDAPMKSSTELLCDCLKAIADSDNAQFINQEMENCFDKVKSEKIEGSTLTPENIIDATYLSCAKFSELVGNQQNMILNPILNDSAFDTTNCKIAHNGKFKYISPDQSESYFIVDGIEAIYQFEGQEVYYEMEWLSDCKYKATVTKNLSKPKMPPNVGESFLIEIIDVHDDTLTLKTQLDGNDLMYQMLKIN